VPCAHHGQLLPAPTSHRRPTAGHSQAHQPCWWYPFASIFKKRQKKLNREREREEKE